MNLVALPAFADNYIWMLHDGHDAVVIDPGDAAPVIAALDHLRLSLAAILVTHHHGDHVGGLSGLRDRLQGLVYGPRRENIPTPFEPVEGGQQVTVLGQAFTVIDVPGHTAGHVAYASVGALPLSPAAPVLFCGDTLFSGGCGRLFEGTAAQMHQSLGRLMQQPADTLVCCAHEYTLSNLRFAAAVEPDNRDIAAHVQACETLRAQGQPTLPSTLAQERRINPFLRCDVNSVISAARQHGAANDSGADVLGALREWKNQFK